MQSNTNIPMTASEYKNSSAYADIQSTAIQYLLYESRTIHSFIEQSIQQRDEIRELRKKMDAIQQRKSKKQVIDPKFCNTAHAAAFLDVHESFLNKKKEKDFKLGKHYFKPSGQSIVRWSIDALSEWMQSDGADSFANEELAELLKRS